MKVSYEPRFGELVPEYVFPLHAGKAKPSTRFPKWWYPLLDFAESYFRLTPEELSTEKGVIPLQFNRINPKNPFLAGVHADIVVSMRFFHQWSLSDDDPLSFPRGVQVLIDSNRDRGLRAVQIGRARDWALYAVYRYGEALNRCRSICDATRRGHLAPMGERLWFRTEDVEKAMGRSHSVVNLVDYAHIYRVLLSEAISPPDRPD